MGTWADADWELDAVYELDADEPSPLLPGLEIPMHYEFGVARRVACDMALHATSPTTVNTPADTACVELLLSSSADQEAVRTVVQQFLQSLCPGDAPSSASIETRQAEHEVILIAEPGSLRPYALEVSKFVEVHASATDAGPASIMHQLAVRRMRFRWH
jgi:hypothetical protein